MRRARPPSSPPRGAADPRRRTPSLADRRGGRITPRVPGGNPTFMVEQVRIAMEAAGLRTDTPLDEQTGDEDVRARPAELSERVDGLTAAQDVHDEDDEPAAPAPPST